MKIIDLTKTLSAEIEVYDEFEKPSFGIVKTVQSDGYKLTKLNLYSHNGTHIDSPSHILQDGLSLDKIDITNFIGKAIKISYKNYQDYDLYNYDFVVLDDYYNFELVTYLLKFKLKGLVTTKLSIEEDGIELHKLLFSNREMILIENICNYDLLSKEFTLMALPLKFNNSDGAPARIIGVLNDEKDCI